MKTIRDLIGKEKNKSALVVCTGSIVGEKKERIDRFIEKTKPFIVGVNNMTMFWIPDYHIWTNNKRFRTYGGSINRGSELLLGSNISIKVIKEIVGTRDYIVLDRVDREGVPIGYKNGIIYGYHRTAGCVAITISHLMEAKEINIVGMDGHTFHNYQDVKNGKKDHHFYDENYTPYSPEVRTKKDEVVNGVLQSLKNYGMSFNILTPTVYTNFYKKGEL